MSITFEVRDGVSYALLPAENGEYMSEQPLTYTCQSADCEEVNSVVIQRTPDVHPMQVECTSCGHKVMLVSAR